MAKNNKSESKQAKKNRKPSASKGKQSRAGQQTARMRAAMKADDKEKAELIAVKQAGGAAAKLDDPEPPTLEPPAYRITHPGHTIYGSFTGFSPRFAPLTYSLKGEVPDNVTLLDPSAGVVKFEPSWDQVQNIKNRSDYGAQHQITLQVSDVTGTAEATWTVEVADEIPNCEIPMNIPDAHPGRLCQVGLNAVDMEGDELQWEKLSGVGEIDPATGLFSWTPTWDDVGLTRSVEFKVYEPDHPAAFQQSGFGIYVRNNLPTGVQDEQDPDPVAPGQVVTCKITAADDENDLLQFSVHDGPGYIIVPDANKPYEAVYHWYVPPGQTGGTVDVTVRITERDNPAPLNYAEVPFTIDVEE